MSWYDSLFLSPVKAVNEVKSNVWSVILIITGITLVMHGHENVGGSLVTGAFAVFRSSRDEPTMKEQPKTVVTTQVSTPAQDPNVPSQQV
jgi:hypothetical protein